MENLKLYKTNPIQALIQKSIQSNEAQPGLEELMQFTISYISMYGVDKFLQIKKSLKVADEENKKCNLGQEWYSRLSNLTPADREYINLIFKLYETGITVEKMKKTMFQQKVTKRRNDITNIEELLHYSVDFIRENGEKDFLNMPSVAFTFKEDGSVYKLGKKWHTMLIINKTYNEEKRALTDEVFRENDINITADQIMKEMFSGRGLETQKDQAQWGE